MKITEVLDPVYDDEVGWKPSTGTIKPVHVANGLLRELRGGHADISNLHEFLVWWTDKRKHEDNDERSSESLLAQEATHEALRTFRGQPELLDRMRRYAYELLGADRALFPSRDHSSLSLTSFGMVSPDRMDKGLGTFAALLVESKVGGASLGEIVREAATQDDQPMDPVTALVWPFLQSRAEHANSPRKAPKSEKLTRAMQTRAAVQRKHHVEVLKELREAAASLATHERAQGNRLRTLQRAVQFACVATFTHAHALSADGRLGVRRPVLLAISGHKGSDIARASEGSVEQVITAFEDWLGDQLGKKLPVLVQNAEEPLQLPRALDGRSVRAFLRKVKGAKDDEPTDSILTERMAIYEATREERAYNDVAQVLGHTLARCYFDEFDNGGPRRFLVNLGRRVGLLYPHFQGRSKEKRVRPSVLVLDMMVRGLRPLWGAGAALRVPDTSLEPLRLRRRWPPQRTMGRCREPRQGWPRRRPA